MKTTKFFALLLILAAVVLFFVSMFLGTCHEANAFNLMLISAIVAAVGAIILGIQHMLKASTPSQKFVRGFVPIVFLWLATTLLYLLPSLHQYVWLGYTANILMTIAGIWTIGSVIILNRH